MGILKLMDFIKLKAPSCIVSKAPTQYRNKILAIDVSNWMYQFLIKTQTLKQGSLNAPTDPMGNQTGHLIGLMARVAFCLQNKISTVWVFDGKPPQQKYDQLRRRKAIKQSAQQKMEQAKEQGEQFDLLKMSKRSVKITQVQKNYAKRLIQLTGLPMIQSPSQAQPQCAQIVKSGLAYACVSQDLDNLPFGCPKLIRHFSKPQLTSQVQLSTLLKQIKLTYDQFIDFCILCGCDYTSRIKNIGPIKAYQLILKYKTIDRILEQIAQDDKMRKRHTFSDDFNHLGARKIFKTPEVKKLTKQDIKIGEFKEQQLFQFLKQKEFSENRIQNWIQRIHKSNFFT